MIVNTIGAKRRWLVDILTEVFTIVNQNDLRNGFIVISALFCGGSGGRGKVVNY